MDDIRQGRDRHVCFGLDHPAFYALLYGQVEPGKQPTTRGPVRR
ncbi:hypothetical protein ACTWPT_40595 [Nonomuraea sp. 3N208]